MNRSLKTAGWTGMAAIMAAGCLWAGPMPGGAGGGAPASVSTKQGHRGAHWKEKLGLTDDQAAKLQAAVKARDEAVRPLRDQRRQAMQKLGEQLKSKAADKDIQATLDQLASVDKSLQAERQKFMESAASFLTPTQRAQFLVGMMHRGEGKRAGLRGRHLGVKDGPGAPPMATDDESDTPDL